MGHRALNTDPMWLGVFNGQKGYVCALSKSLEFEMGWYLVVVRIAGTLSGATAVSTEDLRDGNLHGSDGLALLHSV